MQDLSSLRDVLFANRHIGPDRRALFFGGRWTTHRALRDRVAAVAAALRRDGVAPGDRVAVLLENVPEFIEIYFAATGIGAIFVPLNWRLHPAEMINLMRDAEAKMLVAAPAYADAISRARSEVTSLRQIVVTGEGLDAFPRFAEWSKESRAMPAAPGVNRDSIAAILYTSGTTSRPKGVMLSHGNYLSDFSNVASVIRVDQNGSNLQLSPLYHAACVHSFVHLAFGGATILNERFDPELAMQQIEREKVTYLFAVPTMLYQMMDHANFTKYDLSSLSMISYGAAGITKARLEQAMNAFGPKLIHAYGLTETTSHASILRSEDHAVAVGSIGRGLGDVAIRVVDEAGQPCRAGEVGEIIVRGPNVMQGYWRQPEATKEALVDGWLRTGDLGRVDAHGFIYVVDRKKDMVISGGVNIYTREVEDVISAHPGIAEVAAFGVPDARWGEALVAAVVPRQGASLDFKDLLEFCRGRVAGYKVPKRIEIVSGLPRNASGKILKTELRTSFASPGGAPART